MEMMIFDEDKPKGPKVAKKNQKREKEENKKSSLADTVMGSHMVLDGGMINPFPIEVPIKSYEDKLYIVLLYVYSDDNRDVYDTKFKICTGRTSAIDYITENIEIIDVHESLVLVETRQTETKTGDIKNYFLYVDAAESVYGFFKFLEAVKDFKLPIDIEDYSYNKGDEDNSDTEEPTSNISALANSGDESFAIWSAVQKNGVTVDTDEEELTVPIVFDEDDQTYNV